MGDIEVRITGLCKEGCKNYKVEGKVVYCKAALISSVYSNMIINNSDVVRTDIRWPGKFRREYPGEDYVCYECEYK